MELVRGLKCFSDTSPTVWIDGDCWPPYGEVVTRYPLCGASKMNVFVDCIEGQANLTFGLIFPYERRLHFLGIQNGEHLRLSGKLWAWNSKSKQIFYKPYDSRTNYGSSSQITHLYDNDIVSGSILCIYRNLQTNRIHFVINGKEGMVSFNVSAPAFCYGYVRLCSRGSDSKIQVTLRPEPVDRAYFIPITPNQCGLVTAIRQELEQQFSHETQRLQGKCTQLEQENIELQDKLKESERRYMLETREHHEEVVKLQMECNQHKQEKVALQNRFRGVTELDRYKMGHPPRGICLVINNVNFLDEPDERWGSEIDEKEITALFSEELHFKVEIRRNLGGQEILNTAREFAAIDHCKYTAFAFFIMSHGDEKDVIQGVDGRKTRVEDLMFEFTPKNCSTLADKPKLLFIQACRGQGIERRMNRLSASPDWSIEGDTIVTMQYSDSTLANGFSPREADFLLAFATVPGYKAWRSKNSGSWFVQVLVDVIRKHHRHHHLLDMLTEVNKQVADIANDNPDVDLPFQVPAPTHTLRAQVYL
ncbi:hypothetical protein ACROYT_G024506 [Oculina patagonica]